MLMNGGGWGPQVGMAVQLREHGYLIEGRAQQGAGDAGSPRTSRGARSRAIVLRLAAAGLALLVRVVGTRA